jgi:hypothetical protein
VDSLGEDVSAIDPAASTEAKRRGQSGDGIRGIFACMSRLARMVVPGLPYHVTQRGNRREAIADFAVSHSTGVVTGARKRQAMATISTRSRMMLAL